MDIIKFKNKEYEVLDQFIDERILVRRKNKEFVIRIFNDEFSLNEFRHAKKLLKRNKIEMPKLISIDKKGLKVLEEFIVGEPLTSIIALNLFTDSDYAELFRIYRNNRYAKILLSYRPEHFIKSGKYFYYVYDEITPFDQGIAFERSDDILLWLSTETQKRYIISCGFKYVDRKLYKERGEINKQIALICTKFW